MAVRASDSAGAMRRLIPAILSAGLAGCVPPPDAPGAGSGAGGGPRPAQAAPASDADQAIDSALAAAAEQSRSESAPASTPPPQTAEASAGGPAPDLSAVPALPEDGDAIAAMASDEGPDAELAATDNPDGPVPPNPDAARLPEEPAAVEPAQGGDLAALTESPATPGTPEPTKATAVSLGGSATPEQPPALPPVDPALYAGTFDGRLDSRLELAPDQFAAQSEARWNGARTLAGIWVAHPAAPRTMRARIFNLSNGQAADGALYSREGMSPDAPLQVSSEAAQALEMRVNRPADLVIVALRRPDLPETQGEPVPVVTLEIDVPGDDVATSDTPEAAAPGPDAATGSDADAQASPEARREQAETGTAQPPVGVDTPAPPATPPADPGSDAMPDAATPVAEPPADTKPREPPANDARSDGPETDAPAAPASDRAGVRDAASVAADDAGPARSEDGADPAAGGFIQVGIFGVPENSTRLIARLANADIPAEGIPLQRQNRALTRVLAGPFGSEAERDRALRMIEDMGIRDARLVSE